MADPKVGAIEQFVYLMFHWEMTWGCRNLLPAYADHQVKKNVLTFNWLFDCKSLVSGVCFNMNFKFCGVNSTGKLIGKLKQNARIQLRINRGHYMAAWR